MHEDLEKELHSFLEFDHLVSVETLQELWSGYGAILKVHLSGGAHPSIIVKRIAEPHQAEHPRGWNTDVGHQRKLKSYEVEAHWYEHYNSAIENQCRTAKFLGIRTFSDHTILAMEDLDAAGYPLRKNQLSTEELNNCLKWLAQFHAQFLHHRGEGLWPIGTYWHLETRQHEWKSMAEGKLKQFAGKIHETLQNASFQCLIHGDAKFANFCFSESGDVAAVDFQYVGRGCGMKDVVYLLSCIPHDLSETEQEEYLQFYFSELRKALKPDDKERFDELEKEWRFLYPFAWADFERFLQGWAPGHWKSNRSIQEHCETVFNILNK
jgi:hypothetical protein